MVTRPTHVQSRPTTPSPGSTIDSDTISDDISSTCAHFVAPFTPICNKNNQPTNQPTQVDTHPVWPTSFHASVTLSAVVHGAIDARSESRCRLTFPQLMACGGATPVCVCVRVYVYACVCACVCVCVCVCSLMSVDVWWERKAQSC